MRAARTLHGAAPALGLLACVGAGVGWLWLHFHQAPPLRGLLLPADLINYFHPLNEYASRRLAAGELPLWNPHGCGGTPLLATLQVAAFYPGTWLSVWLPAERALPLLLFLHCVAGGWFAALFFRAWGLTTFAAAAGGLLYPFACLLGQTFWPPEVTTLAWLPWLFLCVEKLLQRWQWRWWVGLSAGTALQLLAGFAQFAVYTHYLLLPYAALRLALRWRRGARPAVRAAAGIGLALALGLGLAAPQLLPTLELVESAGRDEPLAPEEIHYLERNARASDLLANVADPRPKLLAFDFGYGGGYLGVATLLALALAAATGLRDPRVWFFAAAGALCLLLSDGYRGPGEALYRIYAALPTGSLFRAPERLRVLALFSAIAVAALGFDRAMRGLPSPSRTRGWGALVVPASAATGVTVLVAGFGAQGAAWRAALALGLVLGMAAARRAANLPPLARHLAAAGLFVLLLVDLAGASGRFGSLRSYPTGWMRTFHTVGHTLLDGEAFARLRRKAAFDRFELLSEEGFAILPLQGSPPVDGGYRFACYEPLLPRQWADLFRAMDVPYESFLAELDAERHAAVFDIASVRYLVEVEVFDPATATLQVARERKRDGVASYRRAPAPLPGLPRGMRVRHHFNQDALPRAYLVERFRVLDYESALARVARGDFDYRGEVLLERHPGFEPAATDAMHRPASITSHAPERVEITADVDRDALLVLTDTHYPGWRVQVDGTESELLRANALYRAVHLPPGSHEVVFEYRPASLRRGFWIAGASLAGIVLLPVVARRRTSPPARRSSPGR